MSIIKNITFRKVDKCTTQSGLTTDGPTVLSDGTLKYDPTTGSYVTHLRVSRSGGSPRPVPAATAAAAVFGAFDAYPSWVCERAGRVWEHMGPGGGTVSDAAESVRPDAGMAVR